MSIDTPHPRVEVMRWLQGFPVGAALSQNDLDGLADDWCFTPKQRAAALSWMRRYLRNTDRTVPATHPAAKGRRVHVYVVVERPTLDGIEAAK